VVAVAIDPAAKGHFLANMLPAQLAAGVGS
jgi:hypothetical protein